MLLIVDDQAAETVDLGGMARQQQGGSVELRQDRRAGDAVAGAEPGAIVDRGVGPAGSQRDGLDAGENASGFGRQLRGQKHAVFHPLRQLILLGKGGLPWFRTQYQTI